MSESELDVSRTAGPRDADALLGPMPVAESGGQWEAEEPLDTPAHDDSPVAAALLLSDRLRAHIAIDRDEDWRDIDVYLPMPTATGGRVVLDLDTRSQLRCVLAEAMDAGWIRPDQLFDFMCGEGASDLEREILRKSLQCLADYGVQVDNEAWFLSLPGLTAPDLPDREEPDRLEVMLADVEQALSPRHDPLWAFARDLKDAGALLDHDDEMQLGQSIRAGICQAVVALCDDEHAAGLLLSALADSAAERQSKPDRGDGDEDVIELRSASAYQMDSTGAEETSGVAPPDERSTHELRKSAVEIVESLRLATLGRAKEDPSRARASIEHLAHKAADAAGFGVVQLGELQGRLSLDKLATASLSACRAGLEAAMEARDRLVRCNLRLVWSIARKYTFSGIPLVDLIQEGCIGLMRAADKYDHTLGFRFSTYATWWIRQSVSRSVADSSRMIRVPVHMFERMRNVELATQTMRRRLDRDPSENEIGIELGLSASEVRKALRVPDEPCSIDDPGDLDWADHLDPTLPSIVLPEDRLELSQLQQRVRSAVEGLKPKEAMILRMRYGLGTEREHTLEEVGRVLDVTRERIRQIERDATNRLRRRLENDVIGARLSNTADIALESNEADRTKPSPVRLVRETPEEVTDPVRHTPDPSAMRQPAPRGDRPVRAVGHALKLLASAQVQRGIAASLDVPSLQKEFAHRWFQAYSVVDPEGTFSAIQHGAFHRLSAELRRVLRVLGFGRLEIGVLLDDPGWQDVMEAASSALELMPDE